MSSWSDDPALEAAAWHGIASNKAMEERDRRIAALKALEFYVEQRETLTALLVAARQMWEKSETRLKELASENKALSSRLNVDRGVAWAEARTQARSHGYYEGIDAVVFAAGYDAGRYEVSRLRARLAEAEKVAADLAGVLPRMVVGWEDTIGADLAQHPEVVRVMARYRAHRETTDG